MSSNTPPEWPVEQPDLSADASAESTPLESVCADTAGASLKVETLEAREPGESIESQAGADASLPVAALAPQLGSSVLGRQRLLAQS